MSFKEKLNQAGLRLTRPRRVVMTILEDATIPLSPQRIYQLAVDGNNEVGLVTVYRTLDLLVDHNLVRRVHDHNECHGYVLASPGHHHHLVCRKCGKAIEFTGTADLSGLLTSIHEKTGFSVDEHILQLSGLCPQCQKENMTHDREE